MSQQMNAKVCEAYNAMPYQVSLEAPGSVLVQSKALNHLIRFPYHGIGSLFFSYRCHLVTVMMLLMSWLLTAVSWVCL